MSPASKGPWLAYHAYGDVYEVLDADNDIIARTLETNADASAEANARLMSLAYLLPQIANILDVLARVADNHGCKCRPEDCVIAEARQLFDMYEAAS